MNTARWVRSSGSYRRVVRRLRVSPLVVCEYNGWHGYAIEQVCPDALRIALRPGESARSVLSGIPREARAVLMHVNLSRTTGVIADEAALWASLRDRGVMLLNAAAADIRKRTIHERCEAIGLPSARAPRQGADDERLVVKTNLNYGGAPEVDLARDLGWRAERFTGRLTATSVGSPHYPVYRRHEVPPALWDDPGLVVERFIENPDGIIFRIYVIGPATVVSEVWSDDDIKKLSVPVRARVNHLFWRTATGHVADGPSSETLGRVATLTRRVCQALGVDFGTADCVMGGDGSLVVVDINKTPHWGGDVRPDIIGHLRRGLDHILASHA
jgi:hypothetical protein